ncbi:MAG TPA: shikimate kinase [Syntrophomonas sp.]|nr:shikimate kinase [Syntrophomonas sp.]
MRKNIVLIGFMGTGKSSVGSRLAAKLNWEFVDMDREIESINGMSVSEIFRRYGERRFRSEETLMAKRLALRDNLVIATGGGVVMDPDNITILRPNSIIILLEARAQDIWTRVNRKKGTRPLLKGASCAEDIEKLLAARAEHYGCADIRINTSDKDLELIIQEILQKIEEISDHDCNN